MHERQIVHRDLALNNVMLVSKTFDAANFAIPVAKIIDFGLASQLVDGVTGEFMNEKWEIMGPEWWNGGPYTPQSEAYCFGIMMYQLYTQCRMLKDISLHEVKKGKKPDYLPLPEWQKRVKPAEASKIMQELEMLNASLKSEILLQEPQNTSPLKPSSSTPTASTISSSATKDRKLQPIFRTPDLSSSPPPALPAHVSIYSKWESLLQFTRLMDKCLRPDPTQRPNFDEIKRKLGIIWYFYTGVSPLA